MSNCISFSVSNVIARPLTVGGISIFQLFTFWLKLFEPYCYDDHNIQPKSMESENSSSVKYGHSNEFDLEFERSSISASALNLL